MNAAVEFVDPRRIQPVMDVRAEARIQSYVVEMSPHGDPGPVLARAQFEPPLSEFDILSLLTVGQVPKTIAGRETGVAAGEAVSFLTGRMQDVVEERVRRIAGIDRFQIDPYATTSRHCGGAARDRREAPAGRPAVRDVLRVDRDERGADHPARVPPDGPDLPRGRGDETGQVGGDVRFRFRFK